MTKSIKVTKAAVLSDADKAQIKDEAKSRKRPTKNAVDAPTASPGITEQSEENDWQLIEACGHSECPSCKIHLSNGWTDFEGMVDCHGSEKAAFALMKHEFTCLACGHEWGEEIKLKGGKVKSGATKTYDNKSTIDGAVSKSHALFDTMPDARRKDAIAAAVEAGITFFTARTQYQKWFTAKKNKGVAKT